MEIIITALVAFLALNHLSYAIQNLFNLKRAYGFVEAVFGQQEAPLYPRSIMPALRSPVLIWAGLFVIIAAEISAGLLLATGALQMDAAVGTNSADFKIRGPKISKIRSKIRGQQNKGSDPISYIEMGSKQNKGSDPISYIEIGKFAISQQACSRHDR